MAIVEIRNVKKNYYLGKTVIPALKGVSLQVDRGDFLSVAGPSGCGKSTLLNIAGCIDKPSGGEVFFEGENLADLNDNEEADRRLHGIGFIFQAFNLIPVLTVTENVEFPLILKKVPRKERRERAAHLLEQVGLSDYASHKPDELSGGQRQRVAVARALINTPRLVIADEPTANLDSRTGEAVVEVMRNLNEEEGVSFLFSTHNPAVMKYAKRVVNLKDGEIVGEEG